MPARRRFLIDLLLVATVLGFVLLHPLCGVNTNSIRGFTPNGVENVSPAPRLAFFDTTASGRLPAAALIIVESSVLLVLVWYLARLIRRQRGLRLEVAKLRVMTENAPSCVFRITEDGKLLDVSPDVEEILGWKPEEIVGLQLGAIVHPEDLTKVAQDIAAAIVSKDVVVHRYRILCKDGHHKWVETLSHYVSPSRLGRPREIVGVCHDISTRIDTQQELAAKDSQLRLVQQGIRESEAKYRTLFNEMHAGFVLYEVVFDDEGEPADYRVLEINPAFERLTGLRAEVAIGRAASELFGGFDEDVRNDIIQVGLTGVPNRFVFPFAPTDRYFDVSVFSPKRRQVAAVVIDVTEERRLERKLREEQGKLLEAQRIAGLGYWHYDPTTDMVSYEEHTAEALGLPTADGAKRPLRAVMASVHPDDREYVEGQFHAAVWDGEPFDLVFRVIVGPRNIRYFNAIAKTYYDDEGQPTHVVGTAIDLTERIIAQNELRYQRELFANLIENMPVGAYARSRGRFILWNGAMEALTGRSPADVIGRADMGLFDESMRAAHEKEDLEIINGRARTEREETWDSPSGPKDVHLVKVPVVEENGRDVMVFALAEDVTDKRRMEDRLRQSQKMEAVGQLAGGIAHDFNNILQVILGYGELVRECFEEGSESADDFSKILDAAHRAMTLVSQLLTFSREEEGKHNRLDLNRLISDLVKMIRRVIGEHIELSFLPEVDLPSFIGDPIQIEQLLMNLCINARDAMPEGGVLTITTEEFTADEGWRQLHDGVRTDEFIVISVSDNGTGMTKEVLNRIYEPFFTTKDVGKGTGLGLATVYAIVQRHGGTIDVTSKIGEGTAFRVYFPRTGRPIEKPSAEVRAEPDDLSGSETILLAEDEATVRTLSERTLTSAGYKVLSARDGREAIDLFQSHADEIDALVFDVVMPRRNGWEAYRAIEKARPGLPILFCSGCNDELLQWDLAPPACGQILQKPFTRTVLLQCLRTVLDLAKEDRQAAAIKSSSPAVDLSGVTILIAEDSSSNRKLFRKALREVGAEVVEAANGREAIQAVEDNAIDLILMDIQMPEIDGYAAASRIRTIGFDGPLIALTAHTRPREKKMCEEVGFTAVFGKPVTYRELPAQVAEVLTDVRSGS